AARRRQDKGARSAALQEALGLWRGPALADVAYESWAQEEITRLEEIRLGAIEDELDAQLALGRHAEVLGRLGTLVEEHPLRERLPAQLMLALYRAGRQAEALAVYQKTRSALAEGLGVDPLPDLQRLHQGILRQDPSLQWAPSAPVRTNLPERLTSFVGRQEETKQVLELLAESRLVTLVGTGGSGKTRLAVEVGAALADRYREGVWLVDLAPLTDATLMPQAVATALHVPEDPVRALTASLVDFLRPKQLLLILDNCEHLIEAAADLADTLLSAASEVTILATSREALGVPGETVLQIPPLGLPEAVSVDRGPEAVLQYDAIRLFVDRAAAARPGFTLTDDNVPPVVAICSRLEGLPLALELAAARVRGLGVEAMAARLDDQFRLLTGGRRTRLPKDRSLRGAVDWSYDLLGEPERRVFERLSVFSGGFSLEAAETVASGEAVGTRDVPNLVAGLVDRSLVHLAGFSPLRYRLLEPLRQYAGERLAARGETGSARRRHLGFFLALAETAEPALRGREQRLWLYRLEEDHDNLRAALSTAFELGEPDAGLRLAAALGPFWQMRGHVGEGRERLRLVLSSSQKSSPSRAKALVEAAFLALVQCEYHDAITLCEESLELYRQAGDRWGIAHALVKLGLAAGGLGDTNRAKASLDESLRLFRDLDDGWGVATTLGWLGFAAVVEGSLEQARSAYQESLTWFQEQGDSSGAGMALGFLGDLAILRGELDRAGELLRESLELTQEIGDRSGTARSLASLGRLALRRGRNRDAADLYGRALRMLENLGDREDASVCLEGVAELAWRGASHHRAAVLLGAAEVLRGVGTPFPLPVVDPAGYQERVAALRCQLGNEQLASAWARGRSMTLDQACQFALHPDPEER
ncbi:MAG TPA: BTAD domain-containing putative transcriptional regulator, partial [Actinomycetes bacterium]|nr:BTAD domain-containing putative transcriptional regulator [Actinomycetes bacterium]